MKMKNKFMKHTGLSLMRAFRNKPLRRALSSWCAFATLATICSPVFAGSVRTGNYLGGAANLNRASIQINNYGTQTDTYAGFTATAGAKGVLDWNKLNVPGGATLEFHGGTFYNVVNSMGGMTTIAGVVKGTGGANVSIFNPNGILMQNGSEVNVEGIFNALAVGISGANLNAWINDPSKSNPGFDPGTGDIIVEGGAMISAAQIGLAGANVSVGEGAELTGPAKLAAGDVIRIDNVSGGTVDFLVPETATAGDVDLLGEFSAALEVKAAGDVTVANGALQVGGDLKVETTGDPDLHAGDFIANNATLAVAGKADVTAAGSVAVLGETTFGAAGNVSIKAGEGLVEVVGSVSGGKATIRSTGGDVALTAAKSAISLGDNAVLETAGEVKLAAAAPDLLTGGQAVSLAAGARIAAGKLSVTETEGGVTQLGAANSADGDYNVQATDVTLADQMQRGCVIEADAVTPRGSAMQFNVATMKAGDIETPHKDGTLTIADAAALGDLYANRVEKTFEVTEVEIQNAATAGTGTGNVTLGDANVLELGNVTADAAVKAAAVNVRVDDGARVTADRAVSMMADKGAPAVAYADGTAVAVNDPNGLIRNGEDGPVMCVVTLDPNGGTGGTAAVTATYGAAMPAATMPTRTGYTFWGFWDATAGGTRYYLASGESSTKWDKTAAATLYAHWTANTYAVTFNPNGGTGGTTGATATYDAAMPAATMPTRFGCNFLGYFDAAEGCVMYYDAEGRGAFPRWQTTSATTLYAHWQAYAVTFDATGGAWADGEDAKARLISIDTENSRLTYNFPEADPVRADHAFLGWYESWTNGARRIESGDELVVGGDHTLSAKWKANACAPAGDVRLGDVKPGVAVKIQGAATNASGAVVGMTATDLVLPDRISNGENGEFVTAIAAKAFQVDRYDQLVAEEKRITGVTLPVYLTTVGDYAFYGCEKLSNVTFSAVRDYRTNAKTPLLVGTRAFAGTGLETVVFPAGTVTKLSVGSFAACPKLREIFVYGEVQCTAKEPFARSGGGGEIVVHLSPAYAADAAFVENLTADMSTSRVKIDTEPVGLAEIKGTLVAGSAVTVRFKVAFDSPWGEVNANTVSLFYATDLAAVPVFVGTGNVAYPTAVTGPDADGVYEAVFTVPSANSMVYRLTVGSPR